MINVYPQHRHLMNNGDVIEFASNSIIGKMIRLVTRKDVNHTAILWCVDEFKEVKDRKFLMEALSQGIELNLMSARLKNYKGIAYWYKLKNEYDPLRDRVASACLLVEGRTNELRYDYVSLIRNLYRRVNADVEKHSFCSEFVQWVLQESGILKKQKKALRPGEFGKLGIFHPRVMIYSWK